MTAIELSKASGKPPTVFLDLLAKASADAIKTAGIAGPDSPEDIAHKRLKEIFSGIHF